MYNTYIKLKTRKNNLKIKYLILILSLFSLSGKIYYQSKPKPLPHPIQKVSPRILWSIAYIESRFKPNALSKDRMDRGMFQFRKTYDEERGIKNPFDPVESVSHAINIIYKNINELGSIKGIAAYCQGIQGVKNNGPYMKYVLGVLNHYGDKYETNF